MPDGVRRGERHETASVSIRCKLERRYTLPAWCGGIPFPRKSMRWWSRRRPRCCLRAGSRTTPKPGKNHGHNCSRRRCGSALRSRQRRFRPSSRKLKAQSQQATARQDSSATSARAALSRRPERARRRPESRWPGSGSTNEATFSITPQESSTAASRRSSNDSAASCRMPRRPTERRSRRLPRSSRSAKPNTRSASHKFTSGFAPATFISSTSPRR